jgi:hypothetical protein
LDGGKGKMETGFAGYSSVVDPGGYNPVVDLVPLAKMLLAC